MISDLGTSPILVATTEMPCPGTIAGTIGLEQTSTGDMKINIIGKKNWAFNVKTRFLYKNLCKSLFVLSRDSYCLISCAVQMQVGKIMRIETKKTPISQ